MQDGHSQTKYVGNVETGGGGGLLVRTLLLAPVAVAVVEPLTDEWLVVLRVVVGVGVGGRRGGGGTGSTR